MPTIKKRGYAAPKQPEQEIITIAHIVSDFLAKYRKQFTVAVSVLAVIIVLWAGFALMRSQREQKAGPLVAAAYEVYSPANGAAGDYGKALELYRDIQKKYSGTKSAAIAQYYIGNCLMNLGRPDEAIKEYQAFIGKYAGEKLLSGLVYQRMAYAYQTLGKLEDAKKAFEQAESLLGPGVSTVELARLYEAAGNKPEADRKYKVVADKLVGTSWAMDAMGKVQTQPTTPQPMAVPSSPKEAK
ncbi:MAG: tetratricopeptide repeat protein [Nitrospirota bacterium]|jgi:tetratricopeptide (TPR) repeat protein